jgi:D-amino peptidase
MKIYVVVDMEGATGVVHGDELTDAGGERYRRACGWLTSDVNAAVEGALAAGASEVVVSDGHANMRNIDLGELHAGARLIRGPAIPSNKPLCQVADLDASYDLAFLVGFHSRAGTPGGLLSHTWVGAVVHELRLAGQVVGETALDAALLGEHGIPVGLVTGGDDLAREAKETHPDIEVVEVKKALGRTLASCLPPAATAPLIREAAGRAVERHRTTPFRPFVPGPSPLVAEVTTHRREMAARMAEVHGLDLVDERTVRARGERPSDVLAIVWRGLAEVMHEPATWLR